MLTGPELHKLHDTLISTDDSLEEGLLRCGFAVPETHNELDAIQDALLEETGLQSCMGCGVWMYELYTNCFCRECAD